MNVPIATINIYQLIILFYFLCTLAERVTWNAQNVTKEVGKKKLLIKINKTKKNHTKGFKFLVWFFNLLCFILFLIFTALVTYILINSLL